MSEFEFVFSLFGLLFGLSLVELLGGLGRTIEAELRERRRSRRAGAVPDGADPGVGRAFRAGWLTPLLGAFVMLDILSFWAAAWTTRAELTATVPVLLGGLLFAGSYYLAAHLVFPREVFPHGSGLHVDLDEHYFDVRRIVLGAMLALAAVQIGWYLTIPPLAAMIRTPSVALTVAGLAALLIAGIAVRSKAANGAILAVLIGRYVYLAIF